jgi:hypothetical protein
MNSLLLFNSLHEQMASCVSGVKLKKDNDGQKLFSANGSFLLVNGAFIG